MTLTKEWLLKAIAELEEERDAVPGAVNEDAAMALAAMKLALSTLEAEDKLSNFVSSQVSLGGEFEKVLAENLHELYVGCDTAPPAPVSVPDEVASAIESLKQTLVDCNRYNYCFDAVKRVEDACRAAMLQGAKPVTTAYKLPFEQWLSQQTGTIDVECGCVMTEVFFHWLRVAYEAGNSPHCREILNSSTNIFRENAETSTKCPKCGGRGSYHCPQMLGTVECECTLSAPQEVAIR